METAALILAILFFIAGILGTILPILPGAVLVYAGILLYGLMTHFKTLGLYFFVIQTAVLILTFFIDYWASAYGTKRFGGSKQAAWGAVIGAILGLAVFGPLGVIIGPFLGAVLAELLRGTPLPQTLRVGVGTIVGTLGGAALKIIAEVLMILYFFIRI